MASKCRLIRKLDKTDAKFYVLRVCVCDETLKQGRHIKCETELLHKDNMTDLADKQDLVPRCHNNGDGANKTKRTVKVTDGVSYKELAYT